MCTNYSKYVLYGCVLGSMLVKIWNRAHEESKINLRDELPVPLPDKGPDLSPADSYHDIQPLGYGYAVRPIYRANDETKAAYRVHKAIWNGKTYPSMGAMLMAMEIDALNNHGKDTKQRDEISVITTAE